METKDNPPKAVWIIESEDLQRGRRIASDFYLSQKDAEESLELKLKYHSSRSGMEYIKQLKGNEGKGFCFVLNGQFCKYYLRRIDYADRLASDLAAEVTEGNKAKLGIV